MFKAPFRSLNHAGKLKFNVCFASDLRGVSAALSPERTTSPNHNGRFRFGRYNRLFAGSCGYKDGMLLAMKRL